MTKYARCPHTRKVPVWIGPQMSQREMLYSPDLVDEYTAKVSVRPREIIVSDGEAPLIYIDYKGVKYYGKTLPVKYSNRTIFIFGHKAPSLLFWKRIEKIPQNPEERERVESGLVKAIEASEGKKFKGEIRFANIKE